MKASILTLGTTTLLIFAIIIGLYFQEMPNETPENLLNNLSTIEQSLFNTTNNGITYTSLYKEKPTINNVVSNIAHGIIYGIVVEVNTAIPVITYGIKDMDFLTKAITFVLIIWGIIIIVSGVPAIIGIYFYFKERKENKEKHWE